MTRKGRTPGLGTHYFRYASANFLIMAAGFISLPITTRLLTSEQFGILGYWETWALLLAGLLKLGAGDALMRFYPHGKSPEETRRFATNYILLPGLIAFVGWAIALGGLGLYAAVVHLDSAAAAVLAISHVIITVWTSHILWLFGARELSGYNSIINVTWRWLAVAVTLAIIVWVSPTATGVLAGKLLAGTLVCAGLLIWLFRKEEFNWRGFDWAYARDGLVYGFPLALKELSNIVLGFIDRVMIKTMLGSFELVGIYTIGYALASYIDQSISTALGQALTPVANRTYLTEGADAIKALKKRVLRILVYVCVGLAAGIVLAGSDFVLLVAGANKSAAVPVFSFAALVFVAQPVLSTCGMGLLLEKRSRTLLALTATAALCNIAFNIVAIPRLGIMGAVYSTCVCQIGLQVAIYLFCPKNLRCLPSGINIVLALAVASCSVGLLKFLDFFGVDNLAMRLLIAAGWLLLTYALPIVVVDPKIRAEVLQWRRPASRQP